MANEKKYYVVWQGRKPGVYDNWTDCKAQIDAFAGARYKSYPSPAEAEAAFRAKPPAFQPKPKEIRRKSGAGSPFKDSICVDAAWNTATGAMEYQGIYFKTGDLLFKQGPFADGTNNVGEFLAIVHALGYCKNKGLFLLPIYSDSRNAIGWVQKKKANTKLEHTPRNAELFDILTRAEQWLRDNSYRNPILKWETRDWGENPADFGRK
jgi:ribonuclease HI